MAATTPGPDERKAIRSVAPTTPSRNGRSRMLHANRIELERIQQAKRAGEEQQRKQRESRRAERKPALEILRDTQDETEPLRLNAKLFLYADDDEIKKLVRRHLSPWFSEREEYHLFFTHASTDILVVTTHTRIWTS